MIDQAHCRFLDSISDRVEVQCNDSCSPSSMNFNLVEKRLLAEQDVESEHKISAANTRVSVQSISVLNSYGSRVHQGS